MRPRRSPFFCVWEITLSCNAACVHCGSSAGSPRDGELDRAEAMSLCDALASLGVRRVTLSGGEPLVRPEWADIARRLVRSGVEVDLISNGIALDARCAERIESLGLKGVSLSIDGPEEIHDPLRGVAGAYTKAMEAARHLRRRSVPVGAVTQVNRRNLDSLPRLEAALAEAGFLGWQLQLTMPIGRCKGEGSIVLKPREVTSIIRFIVEASRRRSFPVYAADNIGWMLRCEPEIRSYAPPGRRFFRGCQAGLSLIGITSSGDLRGCLSLPPDFNEGNIRMRELADIWHDGEAFSYNRKFRKSDLKGRCSQCAFWRTCRAGCTCLAYASAGKTGENGYCARLFLEDGDIGEGS